MECPGCHYENPADSCFCGECGSSLIREGTCSTCGHSNPGGQKFCNSCGNRLFAEAEATGHAERLAKEIESASPIEHEPDLTGMPPA